MNWQAEYREAMASEECEEIRRFYKPYLGKYESKYRFLYQMLQQANRQMGQTGLFSTQESISEITPSLAALDDAQVLRRKEWKRGESGEDMPRQYPTVSRHLTPNQPKHEDMRIYSTLNVTPEGSLSDLPAAVGGVEESRREQETWQTSEKGMQDVCHSTPVVTLTEKTPNTFIKTVPGRDLSEQELNQVEPPRRILRTREACREEAIALTKQFFATVSGWNQVETSEPPAETPTAYF